MICLIDHECENCEWKKQQMNWQVSSFPLWILKVHIEKHVQFTWEEFVDVKYNMVVLVDLAYGFKFERRANGRDVDD